jgi:hypothetical protein
MHPRAVHFNELNGQPLHINDHIKYESQDFISQNVLGFFNQSYDFSRK